MCPVLRMPIHTTNKLHCYALFSLGTWKKIILKHYQPLLSTDFLKKNMDKNSRTKGGGKAAYVCSQSWVGFLFCYCRKSVPSVSMGATLFIQPIRRCEDGIWGATMGNQLTFPPVSSTWLGELLQSHPRGKLKSKRKRWSWPQHTHRNETSAALLVRTVGLTWCHGAGGAGTGGQSEKSSGCSLCTGRAWCLCACGNGEWAHLSEQISRSSHPRCIYKASLLTGEEEKHKGSQWRLDTKKITAAISFHQGFGQKVRQSLWRQALLQPSRSAKEELRRQALAPAGLCLSPGSPTYQLCDLE